MSAPVVMSVVLDPDARNVGSARRALREAMARSGADAHADTAVLLLSEIVTNAFVHTGSEVRVRVWTTPEATRVEVQDAGAHLPTRRHYAESAATGRGLQLVEELADRWGAHRLDLGKAVWFEIGSGSLADREGQDEPRSGDDVLPREVPVTLRRMPLLMHWAWQEHAAALLREFLLHVLDEDPFILDRHAQASDAMSLLNEQIPPPALPDEPDALMATALEPLVTADELVLRIPSSSVEHFATLDRLLRAAISEARSGRFLGPPTQPEIDEMRQWICAEVRRQSGGEPTATPWVARTDVRATLADQASLTEIYASLASTREPLLATDQASIIVAASPAALALLGYDRAEDLLGRRVLVVVPERFHQAHIAGTTLNATNGRDHLLGVPLVVPMVRADGTELRVNIEVTPQRLLDGQHVFVARFEAA